MNTIILENLELKIFTEQDALDYCQLNGINPEDITQLLLYDNELTDISGVKLFKNLKSLYLSNNKLIDIFDLKNLINLKVLSLGNNEIKDISVIKNLNNLEILYIQNLELESDQIEYIKSLKKLKYLYCGNGFKDMNITNQLNKNIKLW